jgi:PAT family beta-lactamase induction signal transducer AmpG
VNGVRLVLWVLGKLERRSLVMLALGFSAGLPNLLIFDTLSAWLRETGTSLQTIGFFSLATLTYSLKFLWAPLVDRTALPFLTPLLGHRRSWMLASQAMVVIGLWLISGANPTENLPLVAGFAVLVSVSSATQDIVIDAWRIEAAGEERQGTLAALYQWGYRMAIITAGVAPLMLAARISWGYAYGVMAALMGIGVAAVLAAPREQPRPELPSLLPGELSAQPLAEGLEWAARLLMLILGGYAFGAGFTGQFAMLQWGASLFGAQDALAPLAPLWNARPHGIWLQVALAATGLALIAAAALPVPGTPTRPGLYFQRSYGEPIRDFFSRFPGSAGLVLALICSYRLSDFVLNIMNPFYLDIGFDKDRIAEIRKVFGVLMLMAGVSGAGWSIARFGLLPSLIAGAVGGPASNLVFAWLATAGPDWRVFATAIAVDNASGGFAGTVLIAYMSSLTSAGFTATQYALFSSLYALPGKLIAAQSGAIVESCARLAAPGGPLAALTALFGSLPPQAFANGAAPLGVPPAALGAGYLVFFLYSCAVGVAALALAVVVARRQRVQSPPSAAAAA